MREYLFRGKRKGDKEWQFGHLHIIEWDKPAKAKGDYIDYRILGRHNECSYVDPETVGQYTGLTDKNGVKIFEGDVVLLDEDVKETFRAKDGEVLFCRGVFFIGDADRILNCMDVLADYSGRLRGEVIGNIHDNQELLEEGGEEWKGKHTRFLMMTEPLWK